MLQYKIPQNVGIEDKIVGPLTLRQLIILAIGGGMSYVLFAILSKIYEMNFIEYAVIALPAIVAAAMALLRINDIAFPKFVLLTLEFNIKPKKRVWDHRGIATLVAPNLLEEKKAEKNEDEKDKKGKNINLNDLSRILDSGGFDHIKVKNYSDIDQAEDQDLITEAFFGNKETSTKNMYWRSNKHDRGKRLQLLAQLPKTSVKKEKSVLTIKAAVEQPPAKPVEKPMAIPMPSLAPPALAVPFKKKRRRHKKRKPDIARKNTAVDTTDKNKPVQFMPRPSVPLSKPPVAKAEPPQRKQPEPKTSSRSQMSGEFNFSDLENDTIEIKLD